MKTRFDSLVKIKKDDVQVKERNVQSAFVSVTNATDAVTKATNDLNSIEMPRVGTMGQMLQTNTILGAQRAVLVEKRNWLSFATSQLNEAREHLKQSQIELEKYNYLKNQEIQKELQRIKKQESKDLDEIALISFMRHKEGA
ncbi:MAG: flagellar export protein FliJ [Campylobacterota bacterium]|nr:flagellar export protein FliJ [Campylobacterota bacterium]